jgi:hypothetical protein
MNSVSKWMAALTLLGAPLIGKADIIYTYIGNPLIADSHYSPGSAPIDIRLTFSNNGSSLVNWSASQAQVGTISSATLPPISYSGALPQIDLTTNVSGQVTSWYVSLLMPFAPYELDGSYSDSLSSFNGQILGSPTSQIPLDDAASVSPLPARQFLYIGSQNNPGKWSSAGSLSNLDFISNYQVALPPPKAPELDASSAAGALTLLLGALAVLRGRRDKDIAQH